MLFKKNICVISLNHSYYNRGAWQWLDEKAACCQQYAGSVTCSDLDVNTPAAPPTGASTQMYTITITHLAIEKR